LRLVTLAGHGHSFFPLSFLLKNSVSQSIPYFAGKASTEGGDFVNLPLISPKVGAVFHEK
jgi:hypothetical protein